MGGLYAFLARARPLVGIDPKADALFVFAGGMVRKRFGAKLWRQGVAPLLILSVGRFEWRRHTSLDLPGGPELAEAAARVPPEQRHFFLLIQGDRVEVVSVPRKRFGTRNEARALAILARERGLRSIIALSSGFHLRRVSLATRRALQGSGVALTFAAVPESLDPFGPRVWHRTRLGRRLVFAEAIKIAVYTLLLRR